MIFFTLFGSVIEGEVHPVQSWESTGPLFVFRVQHPIEIELPAPLHNGKVIEPVATVRNRAMSRDVSRTLEYQVPEPGTIEVTSYMDLKIPPTTMLFGVYRQEDGFLLQESFPSPYPWFIDGEFVEPNPDGTRSILAPFQAAPVDPDNRWERLGGDFL